MLAVIGITASGVGVDLSAAALCVFAELPPDAAWLCQAEDRLHRRGQRQAEHAKGAKVSEKVFREKGVSERPGEGY